MIKAWAYRNPSRRALVLAAGLVPILSVVGLELSTRGTVSFTVQDAFGLGLVLLAYEAGFHWAGLGLVLLSRNFVFFLVRTLEASAAGLGLAWLGLFALPGLPPGYLGAAVVGLCSAGLLVAVRSVLPLLVAPRRITDGVLLVGREDLAAELYQDLRRARRVQGFAGMIALDPPAPGEEGRSGVTLDPVQLRTLVQQESISRIVVVEPDREAREEIASALLECRLLGVEVEDAVELYQRLHGKLWLAAVDPGRLAFSEGFRITPVYRALKRFLDLACAVLLLVVSAPVMAVIALAVKLESPGPVLFRQERLGQFGKSFTLFKFRSMRQDAEAETGPTWCRENDDRVTRIGGFLRKSHLDELPQVLNVLRGDLSFVGPRPERPCFVEMLRRKIHFYDLRLYVRPGITGWAQVRCPYAGSIEDSYEKLQYDLYYARNASLGLDLRILFRTAAVMLTGSGR
ncbi:MAG TPA: sugar transferase [Thermoanaerobaculia bacterium]|nr:sugar transferase [Thermoanaerobaculia bacterium]